MTNRASRLDEPVGVSTDWTAQGFIAFVQFACGDWPFKGRKTPKNPHAKGTPEHAEWQTGYDAALLEWFS